MRETRSKINPCERCPALDCPRKKTIKKEGRFKILYHWQKVAGGWSKLARGVIKKNNERRF